jgi:arsenate reductase-like glutaredoxin family protein
MARKNSFNFPQTCPKIDNAIDECKRTLEDYLFDYIVKLSPDTHDYKVRILSKEWAKKMYEGISDCFEAVRETNENMRDEANYQIADLEEEILSLKDEIESLENQLLESKYNNS